MADQRDPKLSFFAAIKNGSLEGVRSCIEAGCSVDEKEGTKDVTALYVATQCNHPEICEFLLQNGADVNAQTTWQSTPLHVASERGHTACALRLLLFGADVNCRNRRGETPLHLSAKRGHVKTVELLVGAGAKIDVRDRDGLTPQRSAEAERQQDTANVLSKVKDTLGYLQKRFQDDKIKLAAVLEKNSFCLDSVRVESRSVHRLDLAVKALVQLPVQWQNEIAAVFREQVDDTDLVETCEDRKQLGPHSWSLGLDYTIKGDIPLNSGFWDRGIDSVALDLLFEIDHHWQGSMMLKVVIGLRQTSNGHKQLKIESKIEDRLFCTLPPHPNLVKMIHKFEAKTITFERFIPSTLLSKLHDGVTLENVATCLVTDKYPLCLKCIYDFLFANAKAVDSWADVVGETFLCLVMIQALKGIEHLRMHGISNRKISMASLLLDNQMQVVITDKLSATQCHQVHDGFLTEEKTIESACTECLDVHTLAKAIETLMHLPDRYIEDEDMCPLVGEDEDMYPTEINYSQKWMCLLTSMQSNDQEFGKDVTDCLSHAGAFLFFRDSMKLENKEEFQCWITANLISQTLLSPEISSCTPDDRCLTMQIFNLSLDGRKTLDTLRRKFLCQMTFNQLWSGYKWVTCPI